MSLQVTCTEKHETLGQVYEVKAISGKTLEGSCWKFTQEAAIAEIEAGRRFFVELDGFCSALVVGVYNKSKYLKTELDQEVPIILLALPDC
jgi:hypothetical protein